MQWAKRIFQEKSDGWWNTMGLGVWGFWTLAKPKPLAEQVVFGSL